MSVRKRRDSTEIKYDILASAIEGEGKTHIMYATGLNFRQLSTYIEELMATGALEYKPQERQYFTTERGKAFAKAFEHYRATTDLLYKQEEALFDFFPTIGKRTIASRQ